MHLGCLKPPRSGACGPLSENAASRLMNAGQPNSRKRLSIWLRKHALPWPLETTFRHKRLSVGPLWTICGLILVERRKSLRPRLSSLVGQLLRCSAMSCRKRQKVRLGSSVRRLVGPRYEWMILGTVGGREARSSITVIVWARQLTRLSAAV